MVSRVHTSNMTIYTGEGCGWKAMRSYTPFSRICTSGRDLVAVYAFVYILLCAAEGWLSGNNEYSVMRALFIKQ